MSNQISIQANKLWQILSAPATRAVYQQTLSMTWTILQETGRLIWLLFCLVLVAFDGFWRNSVRLGRETRAWVNRFDRPNDIAAEEMWQEMVSSTQSRFNALVTKARKQLGLSAEPDLSIEYGTGGAIVPRAEIAQISTVSPMKQYEAAGEDEPVIIKGGFMASRSGPQSSSQGSSSENPSVTNSESINRSKSNESNESIETNAKPEAVTVNSVSPKEKDRFGEDEEVEHSPLKESNS